MIHVLHVLLPAAAAVDTPVGPRTRAMHICTFARVGRPLSRRPSLRIVHAGRCCRPRTMVRACNTRVSTAARHAECKCAPDIVRRSDDQTGNTRLGPTGAFVAHNVGPDKPVMGLPFYSKICRECRHRISRCMAFVISIIYFA